MWYSADMTTITIPRQFAAGTDLIVLRRSEYEAMKARMIPEYMPTPAERRSLARSRAHMHKNRVAGKLISLDVLKRDLASRG